MLSKNRISNSAAWSKAVLVPEAKGKDQDY